MKELVYDILKFAPLVVLTPNGQIKLNYPRLFELLLTALLSAVIANYVSTKVLEVKLNFISDKLSRVEQEVDGIRRDLYVLKVPTVAGSEGDDNGTTNTR